MPIQPLTPLGSGVSTPAIRPAATPEDTFIRPAAAGGSLAQLAAALSSVAPQLGQIGNEMNARDAQKQADLGEAWAADQQNSQAMWSGAIADNTIYPSQSPWFRIAAKRKLGQFAADKFNVALQQNIAKLGDAPAPAAFDQAVADTRKSFLSDVAGKSATDLSFMQGFNAVADQHMSTARRVFAAENAKQFELQASDAYSNATHAMARQAIEAGKSTDDIATLLNNESSAWAGTNPAATRASTLGASKLSKLNSDVLFQLMRSTHNVKLVTDLAAKIKDGDGVLLDSPEFQNRLEVETDHVTEDARQKDNDAYTQQARGEKDAIDGARETLYSRWKVGGAVDTTDVEASLKKAGVDDPHARAVELLDKMPEMDPTYFVGLRSRIARGQEPAQAEMDLAARSHRISAGQYASLVSDIAEAKRAERALQLQGAATTEGIWSHPAMKAIEDNIKAAAATKAAKGPLGNIISYKGFDENDVQQAIFSGKMYMAQWLGQNWSKYGSAQSALQQAGIAWRGFAAEKGILTTDEAHLGAKVLPSDPMIAGQIKSNSAKASAAQRTVAPPKPGDALNGKPSVDYTRAEIQQMRSDLAGFGKLSPDARAAWIKDPRHRSILSQLGDPQPSELGAALAKAEAVAR